MTPDKDWQNCTKVLFPIGEIAVFPRIGGVGDVADGIIVGADEQGCGKMLATEQKIRRRGKVVGRNAARLEGIWGRESGAFGQRLGRIVQRAGIIALVLAGVHGDRQADLAEVGAQSSM